MGNVTMQQQLDNRDTYTMQLAFAAGGYKDVILTPKTYSLRQLSERLSQVRVGPKDGAYMIRGGDLSITKRSDENLKSAELIILDGDTHSIPRRERYRPALRRSTPRMRRCARWASRTSSTQATATAVRTASYRSGSIAS